MGNSKKVRMHKILSIPVIALGFLLLVFMIVVEDEPGAVPLIMIFLGAAWYIIARKRGSLQNS